MKKLTIQRTNGNVPRSLEGEDHVSGFIAYLTAAQLPAAFQTEHVQAVSTIDRAEALGITADSTAWPVRVLHYQLSEVFRVNPGISLYVGLFVKPQTMTFAEVKTLQNHAGGRIRQVAIWAGDTALTSASLTALQGVCDALDGENAPLIALYAPKVSAVGSLPAGLAGAMPRVSVVIGQDGSGDGAGLYDDADNKTTVENVTTHTASVSALGVVLGLVSLAAVHQSIGSVKDFPTGISLPAFGDGTLLRDLDKAAVEALDTARYLFMVTHVGVSGSYMNDSHNLDAATSDYAMIENVRTMDKAVRGIRTYVTPELGGNVYVDAEAGTLQPYTVSHLETVANKALEDMEKAGELSGYRVEIDPDQDVLSTGTIDMVIKNVAVGVARRINIKIGFYKTV